MHLSRWLSALLILALLLSSAPVSVLAASDAAAPVQAPSVASALSYLLIVTPPSVSIPPQGRGFDVAGYVNIEHARRYAEVQAQLNALQVQGAIAGFTALPSAYAFAVHSPDAVAQAALGEVGRLQATGDLSAAAVDELSGAYAAQLRAAVADGISRQPQVEAAPPPQPLRARVQAPAAMPPGEFRATDADPYFVVTLNNNEVYGSLLAPGTAVTFTLKSGAGVVKGNRNAVADEYGVVLAYLLDVYGNDAEALAGDVLEVQAPDLITIPVVNLQAIPDLAAGRISGFGPPDITSTDYNTPPNLELQIAGGGYVTTTATGAFVAENLPLLPDSIGWLIYANAQGHYVRLHLFMPLLAARGQHGPWWFDSYVGANYVYGALSASNTLVTVTLLRAGSPVVANVTRSFNDGWFSLSLQDLYGNAVPILSGDTLQATDGLLTTTLEVKSFTVVSDPNTDTVAGTTDAVVMTDTVGLAQTLSLWPAGSRAYDAGKTVLAPGGAFSVANPFYWRADPLWGETSLDWGPGQQGFLRYLDAQGNAVFDIFSAISPDPILRLRGNGFRYVAANYVEGSVEAGCGPGSVTLLDAANVVKAQSNTSACPSFSTSFVDPYGNPLPILDGDSVTANFGGRATTVKTPNLTMSADVETDSVAGAITPGLVVTTTYGAPQSLAVYADEYGWVKQNVQPDAEGAFIADFTGQADIQPGAQGAAQYIDAQGNSVFASWQAPFAKPVLHLRGYGGYLAENFVAASLPSYTCNGDGIELLVKDTDGAVRWQETAPVCGSMASFYLADDFGNEINLNPGDLVQATFAGQMAAATVPGFTVLSDAQTDTVSGVTDAAVVTTTAGLTQTLAVWPKSGVDGGYGKHVLLAAGGVFSATNPFYFAADDNWWEENLDWNTGQQGQLRYIDAGGNYVYATFAARLDQPRLDIQKDGNQVSGQLPESYAPVTITVKSGATVKGVGYDTTNLAGEFIVWVFDAAGNPLEIAEGDEIVLAQPPATVVVPPLSAVADVENDRITGKGPANALLNVYVVNAVSRAVTTDANGDYALDLRGFADVGSTDQIGVEYRNAQGDLVWVERYAGSAVSAVLNTDRVWGYAPDRGLPMTVTVKRGGAVIGVDSFVNSNTYFTAFPVSATGQPVVLAAGDVVEVDFGAGVARSLTLAGLSLLVNEQADVISGAGPANSLLALSAAAFPDWYEDSVPVGASGQWSVNLAAQLRDVRPGDMAFVRYSTNGSDTTWLYGIASIFWLRNGGSNYIRGYAAPYTPLTITLKRNGSELAVAYTVADAFGWYGRSLYDTNDLYAGIQAGDVVEVKSAQAGSAIVSVPVPVMEIVLDGPARTVSGVGPANALLGLFTAAGNRTVQTDTAGAFFASFAAQTSNELSWAELRYREPQGNWVYANVQQVAGNTAFLLARWDDNRYEVAPDAVSGRTGAGPRRVLLSLRRNGQVIAAASTWASGLYGYFSARLRDPAGKTVDILAGDVIEMTAGDVVRSMTVPALTVQTNAASRTLFGAGPANTTVQASSCGGGAVDAGGAWVIQCSDAPSGAGYVYVTDLLGNKTYLGWSVPYVWVREYGNEVEGTSVPGAPVQVQLLRGAAIVAEASDVADASNGEFYVQFFSSGGSPVIIQPNDVVVVNAGQPIPVPVTPLTAAVDPAANRITGVAPANAELEVYAATNMANLTRMATAASDGSYTADFTGAANLRPGDWFDVTYENGAASAVWLGWHTPLVRINLGSDIVDGYATPNARASLVLKRAGVVLATAQAQTGPDGEFSAFFLDGSGNLIDLLAGDVVELTASPTVAAAAIALTASVDIGNDTVSGTGPAGASILVVAWRCDVSSCYNAPLTAVANEEGAYVADFTGIIDLDQTSYAYVQTGDAAGNQTSLTTAPTETPRRSYVENGIRVDGAALLLSAYGTGNEDDLTPPQSFEAVGGGRLIFFASGGDLVVTAPNGAITRPDNNYYVVENPAAGKWQMQVQIWSGLGVQYAVAAGAAQYRVNMPIIRR